MTLPQGSFVKEFNFNFTGKRTPAEKKKLEDLRQQKRDEDSKIVTGMFKNLECKGGELKLTYRTYKEDPYRTYTFEDGQTYSIPIGLAKHINKGTNIPEREYATGPDGHKKLYTIIRSKRDRFQFVSTEFM